MRRLAVDRAFYIVDDEGKTYRFLERNPAWNEVSEAENERNKRQLDGYTRIFRDGRTKVFRYKK
jgi:hypothetical protein